MKRLLSLRTQQTALFVIVILVAIAVLATWIYSALSAQVADSVRTQAVSDSSAVAAVLGAYFPPTGLNESELRTRVKQFGATFDGDLRVYDDAGHLLESREMFTVDPPLLDRMQQRALADGAPSADVDFGRASVAVASAPILDGRGERVGVVVLSSPGTQARRMLDLARGQLEIATLVAVFAAGLLGYGFSAFISVQAKRLVEGADAIAAGDFSRRLPRGPFPGEIRELVVAFNRMAQGLGEAFETLRGQEAAQRQFVANASHELRTPIAALKGAIEILETGGKEKPEVRDEFLATMRVEANRLQRLVDNLFTLAQVDSGRLQLQLRPEPADEIAWVVTSAMRPLANEAGIALQADVPTEPLNAICDRDFITQVLLGFVDNAVKHSKPGDIVTVAVRSDDEYVRFSVADTGPGIAPEVLPHIFDRFYTQRKSATGQRKGSGLGLAIAHEIIEAHGSEIEVTSAVGEGTRFSFPVARAA